MHVMSISKVSEPDHFWNALKKAHAKLPRGATWKVAIASTDGATAVNVITADSVDTVRSFLEAFAAAHATTEYSEADAANAIGLPR